MENMYRVSIELQKHEWKFWRTRNAVKTRISTAFLAFNKQLLDEVEHDIMNY